MLQDSVTQRASSPRGLRHQEGFVTQGASSPSGRHHSGGTAKQKPNALTNKHTHTHKHSKSHIPFILRPCNFTKIFRNFCTAWHRKARSWAKAHGCQNPRVTKPAGDKARGCQSPRVTKPRVSKASRLKNSKKGFPC